jgi:hypothetical protein
MCTLEGKIIFNIQGKIKANIRTFQIDVIFFFFVAIGFGLRASCLLSRSLIQESENIQTVELFRNNFNDFLYHTLNYLKIGIFQSAEIIAQCCPVT